MGFEENNMFLEEMHKRQEKLESSEKLLELRKQTFFEKRDQIENKIIELQGMLDSVNKTIDDIDSEKREVVNCLNKLKHYEYVLYTRLCNVGDVYNHRGYLTEEDIKFYESHGCEAVNYDFGIEEYEVIRKKEEPGIVLKKEIK